MSIFFHRSNRSNQLLPLRNCVNRDKSNTTIDINGGKRLKVLSNKNVVKKTSKGAKICPKTIYFVSNLHGLPHFLPQRSNISTQIYLPYL